MAAVEDAIKIRGSPAAGGKAHANLLSGGLDGVESGLGVVLGDALGEDAGGEGLGDAGAGDWPREGGGDG